MTRKSHAQKNFLDALYTQSYKCFCYFCLTYPFFMAFACDILWSICAFSLALFLRNIPLQSLSITLSFGLISTGALIITGSPKALRNYIAPADIVSLLKTTILTLFFFAPYALFFQQSPDIAQITSLKTTFILGTSLFVGWILIRLTAKYVSRFLQKKLSRSIINEKALLFGIDAASETFLHALRSQREPLYDILGIVEKEKHHTHRYIHGIPVLGSIGQLDGIVQGLQKKGKAVDVLLAAPTHLSFQIIALLTQKARTLKISLRQISAASKKNTKIQNLNFSTFLKHSRCEADISNILKTFKSKKILITGAGSCLGKECVLQLANVLPSHITLLDHKANALYDTAQEVHQTHPRLSHKALLCDVRQKKTVFDIIEQEKPDFIFHLAALRQAALVENQPAEGTFTQTLGTKYLADAAKANNVKAMLFVSTCRMQEPRNILDLTQYGGEVYCQFLDRSGGENSTKFLSVRVGAVLGGKNSITTRLQKQIDARKTITLLHPDVSRHFIPLQEAAQLIIHSMFIKLNTLLPHGSTFALDRGEKISLLEMAKTLIELSGLVPYEDIPITFMGLNANSSLKDMPIPPQEKIRRTVHPYIYALEPPSTFPSFFIKNMDKLEKAACENNHDLCTQILKRLSIAEPLSTTPTREVLF